ncbi:MAG TPA: dUTP diphosphatase [Spirochaetia bacterium]|nr:dUTP diphosphatase [Spirochaetia bacterium]
MSIPAGRGANNSPLSRGAVVVRCTARSPELVPTYSTDAAAGADLVADIAETVILLPGERRLIGTGIRIELPPGFEGQVRPRSGLALRHGVTLVNSPGTIDSDYRGEIALIMINLGREPFEIAPRERIAQLVVSPVTRADFKLETNLAESDRGEKGFGSTGR